MASIHTVSPWAPCVGAAWALYQLKVYSLKLQPVMSSSPFMTGLWNPNTSEARRQAPNSLPGLHAIRAGPRHPPRGWEHVPRESQVTSTGAAAWP